MTYEFDLTYALWTLLGVVLGLLIGSATWGRAARRYKRAADSVANAAAAASARTQAEAAQRELAAAQAAMRPLADEVDRLKRELARAKRPVQAPLPLGAEPAPAATAGDAVSAHEASAGVPPHVAPAALAGTGPIVVGDGAVAVPDIRQLKGVGDRFAAALEGIGLGSVDRIARLNADEAVDADTRLGAFNGRIAKDQLVDQCVLLDEGRRTEYEARFGKLGGPVLV